MTEALPEKALSQAPLPANEVERLTALYRYNVLDTPPEAAFDRITVLAARLFDIPTVLVSLVDESRVWFKSSVGCDTREINREATICNFAVWLNEILVIPDTTKDDRFVNNPLVQDEQGVRFYAGAPLLTHDGFNLGTLCLLDSKPRQQLSVEQKATLTDLAAMVVDELELRLASGRIAQIDAALLQVTQGVSAVTGEAFLLSLVQHFTQVLGMDYAYIGLVIGDEPEAVKTIAACEQGQVVDNFEYLLRDTPCQEVIQQKKICCYPRGVQAQFADAQMLAQMEVESYVAIPFFDSTGTPLGLLGVMGRKPLENVQLASALLTLFAMRIVTELERQQAEEALRQRETELRLITNTVPVLISFVDSEQCYRFNNRAYEEWFGKNAADIYGKHLWEVLGESAYQVIRPYVEQVLAGGQVTFESQVPFKDGGTRYISATYVPRLDSQGNVEGFVALVSDMSEQLAALRDRQQAYEAQQESEARFEILADSAPVLIWMSGLDKLCYYFSQAWLDFTGRTLEQEMGNGWLEGVHPDELEHCIDTYATAFDARQKFMMEYRLRRFDGEYRWILDIGVPRFTPDGSFVGYVGSCIDITERKHFEAERAQLLAREQQQTRLLQKLAEASLTINSTLSLNERLRLITDQAREIIATHQSVTSMTDSDNWAQAIHTVSLSDKYAQWRDYNQQPDGSGIYTLVCRTQRVTRMTQAELEAHPNWHGFSLEESKHPPMRGWLAAPLTSRNGKNLGLIQLSDKYEGDFTPEDEAILVQLAQMASSAIDNAQLYEASQQANRVKDEFLAVLSHELRSPLSPILGWSQLLQTHSLDAAKTHQALTVIERNAKLQAELIDDLLDVSKILQGKLSLNICQVDLTSMIQGAIETVRLAAVAKSIQIQTMFKPNVGKVSGDPSRLQQVIWNLLSNAVKFTDVGGLVNIQLERLGSQAQITVSDTGKGISPDFLPYVFDYFRQADATTTRKFGGLGLGLAIVRHLVELHGGTVQAQSLGVGQGTTFTVLLPLILPLPETNQESQQSRQSLDLSGVKILVVDDDVDTREFIAFLLEQYGASVRVVASAREVLTALTQSRPDVLLSDIGMPEEDGYMLIQQVRTLPPDKGGLIPAIALTAYAGEINYQQALKAGFEKHIPKPVEPDKLVEAISNLVVKK
ncbi:PAS domain S-box [Cylindrospermum stagnale PCC 7417]|uniref:Circadian input-output histidine kinase CikA n=1 Tax=Cylindrospermum stagnale PCC 7417 TaxID=56107 RepID=K9WWN0_9NOST|nr:GAF domain-containing protein [Cylindrospermum stagnale]AFZ24593.1 PAS domain S-box [Cylindrospermum stagnale PCC 7417]